MEWFASSPWRTYPLFGSDTAVKAADWFETLAGPDTYMWSYGCGRGTFKSAGGVGTTEDFATKPVYAVHTHLFGSYFGDWNVRDNLLRAPLASDPRTLTCAWVARPAWYMHHVALGETIGYSTRLSQNNASIVNRQLGTYVPNVYFVNGGNAIKTVGDRGVHIALMGDPTLRAQMGVLPSITSASASTDYPNIVNLEYTSTDGGEAYMIYRNDGGTWLELTPLPVAAESLQDSIVNEGDLQYRIHACIMRKTASGTYWDMGQGRLVNVTTTSVNEPSFDPVRGLTMAPNPAQDAVTLSYSLDVSGDVAISVIDLSGHPLLTTRMSGRAAGSHTTSLNTSDLPSGYYLVRVEVDGATTSLPLQIIR